MNKYSKPIARDLNEMSISSGSCFSGLDERTVGDCAATGLNAYSTCGGGTTVYPPVLCLPTGGFAGQSCISGTVAG